MLTTHLRPVILVFLLWLAGLGAAAQFAKIAVPFSAYQALYPEAGSSIGWLLSVVSVVGIFFGLIAGIVVAKIGYIKLLILGLLIGAGVSFWQALLPAFPVMLVSRIIEGASQIIVVVIAPTLIAEVSTTRFRGATMALWSTFFGVSFAVMAWVGLPYLAAHGLAGLLFAHAIYMVVIASVLAAAFYIFAVQMPKSDQALSASLFFQKHISAYKSPNIAAPAIGWLFYTLTFVSLLAIIPTTLPLTTSAALIMVLPLISISTSLIVVSLLLTVVSATQIAIIGFALATIMVALAIMGLPAIYAWSGLFAVLGLIQGASFAAVVQLNYSAEDRALANGAMAQMGNLGNALGTPALLTMLSVYGVKGMLVAICGLYISGGMAHVFLSRKRRG